MTYTMLSVFSGIGGLDLAAHWAGFETVGFIEREPFCQKVLAKHWPGVPIHGDVFEYHDTSHVDVVVGGFPCQPFSVAGNRKGADDERYLLPEMLRIIREVQPYAVLFENVPGFPSLNDGAEFKYLLRTLAEMGFNAEWGHLRASDCGAPHQRERWFCVAYTEGSSSERRFGKRDNQQQGADYSREWFGLRGVPTTGGETMANAVGNGNGDHRTGRTLHHGIGHSSQAQCRRIIQQHGVIPSGASLGYAASLRRQQHQPQRRSISTGKRAGRMQQLARTGYGATEPRLGGNADGLPGWLDFPGWPARPGEDQYPHEPSRVSTTKTPDRAARLKACGNAVVPQVAYPLFVAIHEWIAEILN